MRADTETAIQEGFADIHRLLWPQLDGVTTEEAVNKVSAWLKRESGWLLIFDNADTPNLLKLYIPYEHSGHVLLTSRSNTFRGLGIKDAMELPTLDTESAVHFLLESTARLETTEEEKQAAKELAKELGGLPLALEQAAAYIEQGATFADYLISYREQSIPWLEEGSADSRGYPDSVATTWKLNIDAVEEESPASVELLYLTAFLHPNDIPFEIFESGVDFGPVLSEALDGMEKEPLKLNKILNPLAKYSLLSIDSQEQTYSTHRLVQEVTRHALEKDVRQTWTARAVACINSEFPDPSFSNWSHCRRLAEHVAIAAHHVAAYAIDSTEAARLCACLGIYLESQGQYRLAEPLYQQATEIRRTALGEDHPEFAGSLDNLAVLYDSMGRYEEAEPLCKLALEIRRTALGEDHPDLARSLHNLACLYLSMGRYEEAEPLIQQALEIGRNALGKDHPDFANSLNTLAGLYLSMGRYEEAEPLIQQALEIGRNALRKDHPDFANSLNTLAGLYYSMGRYEEAEPLIQQALEIRRTALGEDHPDFASSLNNLASLYLSMGRYEEAEPLIQQALEIGRNALGKDHPDFANSLNTLAGLYYSMGRYEEAEPLFQQALEIRRTALGEDHPDFANSLNNLARLYRAMGRYEEAEGLYRGELSKFRSLLRDTHSTTLTLQIRVMGDKSPPTSDND